MSNPVDPRKSKPNQPDHGISLHEMELSDLAANAELLLRVEKIFEDAEELWRWMYDQ